MIQYYKGIFGINLLYRVNGSAFYRGTIPGLLSLIISIIIRYYYHPYRSESDEESLQHPYAIGILITAISFLVIYRANYSYARYWEATSSIFHMMSKFLDATTHTSSYHMQQSHYNKIKPPSYFDHHELNHSKYFLTRNRERSYEYIKNEQIQAQAQHNNNSCLYSEPSSSGISKNIIVSSIEDSIRSAFSQQQHTGTTTTTTTNRIGSKSSSIPTNKKISPHTRQLKSIEPLSSSLSSSPPNKNKKKTKKKVFIVPDIPKRQNSFTSSRIIKSEGDEPSLSSSFNNNDDPHDDNVDPGMIFRHKSQSYFSSQFSSVDIISGKATTTTTHQQQNYRSYSEPISNGGNDIRQLSSVEEEKEEIEENDQLQEETLSSSGEEEELFQQENIHHQNAAFIEPRPLIGETRLDGGWKDLFDDDDNNTATFFKPSSSSDEGDGIIGNTFASTIGGRTPPLFIQELAHLSSLLVAVALATLRNDIEGVESPLDIYELNQPWPEVDPTNINNVDKYYNTYSLQSRIIHWLGGDPTIEVRTKYNASRPLPVLGGVSDGEITFIQLARGPSAKTQLCFNWLTEFIIREHLAGSLGAVGPPIISRIVQFLGDGMIYYNHARKIMYIPYPFSHAQLTAFFILVIIPAVPFMLDIYVVELWLSCIISFLTVTCLTGLHEVSRDLENPFRNIPNELPIVTLQAMYNESLLTMYSGYHPDSYFINTKTTNTKTNSDNDGPTKTTKRTTKTNNNNNTNNKKQQKQQQVEKSTKTSSMGERASETQQQQQDEPKSSPISLSSASSSSKHKIKNFANSKHEESFNEKIISKEEDNGNDIDKEEELSNSNTNNDITIEDNDDNDDELIISKQAPESWSKTKPTTMKTTTKPKTNDSSSSSSSGNNNNNNDNDFVDINELKNIILQQSKELERLRLLIETK